MNDECTKKYSKKMHILIDSESTLKLYIQVLPKKDSSSSTTVAL